jgi:endonuclease/exonuclease/phosphatase family metal-dependent hydrolase
MSDGPSDTSPAKSRWFRFSPRLALLRQNAFSAETPRRLVWRDRLSRLSAVVVAVALVGSLVGQVLRDRWVVTALLMYIPLPVVGLAAVAVDLLRGGRTLRRPRFGFAGIGLLSAVFGALPLVAWGAKLSLSSGGGTLTVMQWNVRWGGTGGEAGWQSIVADVRQRSPDIVILSEAPGQERISEMLGQLGGSWQSVHIENAPRAHYLYRLLVASRYPVTLERETPITNGMTMEATVVSDKETMRLLVVDGESNPLLSRTQRLSDVLALCRAASKRGRPIDVLAGDVHSVGRSIGFDAFPEKGNRLASDNARGWRGTFPSWCPLYDIDHVWLGGYLSARECAFVTNRHTDHRGQTVRVRMP